MKTQISRQSYRRDRRFSGVMQQQGRMITDADVNESVQITDGKVNDVGNAAIGSGIPANSSFGLQLDEGQLKIRPGALIAEGAPAWVAGPEGEAAFDYAEQPDYPAPPPLPEGDFTVFADVWDRTVVAAQDLDGEGQDRWHLRDPGLHGADTTTRTQRMAQIKVWDESWPELDLENPEQMPKVGNAPATFTLRARSTASDDCDPCAEEVVLDQEIGNYLFRLEVHDVTYAGKDPNESHRYDEIPIQIVLKWSRENGAEHARINALPDNFKNDVWVYEFFNDTTEKHMGLQMQPYGDEPDGAPRGLLLADFPEDAAELEAYTHVRRWDGYLVLRFNDEDQTYVPAVENDVVLGRDRGEILNLFLDNGDQKPAWGDVESGQSVAIYAEQMTIALGLTGYQIMTGDYWNTPVRELIHEEDQAVLQQAPPQGIEHRYITLFRVRDGRVINNPRESVDDGEDEAMTAAEERKLSFPKLTDIPARKVSYDPCLHEGSPFHENDDTVQAALDRICQSWPELQGGGCSKTVGRDGDYETLEDAFLALKEERDICLCLLPGDHVFQGEILTDIIASENNLTHISITGCGAGTRLKIADRLRFAFVKNFVLKQVHLNFVRGADLKLDECHEVTISDCHFYGRQAPVPLLVCANCRHLSILNTNIEVDASRELTFKHNEIMLRAFEIQFDPNQDPFIRAFENVDNYDAFSEAVVDLLQELKNMPPEELHHRANGLRDVVEKAYADFELNDLEWLVYQEPLNMMQELNVDKLTAQHFQLIRMSTLHSERGPALEIGPAGNDVRIEGCRINGLVKLHAPFGEVDVDPDQDKVYSFSDFFKGRLTLRRNHFARVGVDSFLIAGLAELLFYLLINKEPNISFPVDLPQDLHLKSGPFYRLVEVTDNVFALPFNKIFAEASRLNSNLFQFNFPLTFNYDGNDDDPSGKDIKRIPVLFDVYSRHSTYVGNSHNARMELEDLYFTDHFMVFTDLVGYDYFDKISPELPSDQIQRTILNFQNDLLILPRNT